MRFHGYWRAAELALRQAQVRQETREQGDEAHDADKDQDAEKIELANFPDGLLNSRFWHGACSVL
jgi:hypothetical protein